MSEFNETTEKWMNDFADPPKASAICGELSNIPPISIRTPEEEAEFGWSLVQDTEFEYSLEGKKILQERYDLDWERDERSNKRFGKQICLEDTSLSPEQVNAAKEQLRLEAEGDRRYFAPLYKLLNEREKIIYAELKVQFLERIAKPKERESE
ncbi:hypothetical protein QEZ52_18390 [Aliisedimentitalea scapharcae]|uniref:Uncharacterized protein n=1 Tax=Aliisedimentitalea scapharcae TaxID=1524259 RepID=A0ABZ2XR30_9RHOB